MDVGTCLIQTLDGALLMEVEIQPGSSQQGVTGFNEDVHGHEFHLSKHC